MTVPLGALKQFLAALQAHDLERAKALAFRSAQRPPPFSRLSLP